MGHWTTQNKLGRQSVWWQWKEIFCVCVFLFFFLFLQFMSTLINIHHSSAHKKVKLEVKENYSYTSHPPCSSALMQNEVNPDTYLIENRYIPVGIDNGIGVALTSAHWGSSEGMSVHAARTARPSRLKVHFIYSGCFSCHASLTKRSCMKISLYMRLVKVKQGETRNTLGTAEWRHRAASEERSMWQPKFPCTCTRHKSRRYPFITTMFLHFNPPTVLFFIYSIFEAEIIKNDCSSKKRTLMENYRMLKKKKKKNHRKRRFAGDGLSDKGCNKTIEFCFVFSETKNIDSPIDGSQIPIGAIVRSEPNFQQFFCAFEEMLLGLHCRHHPGSV